MADSDSDSSSHDSDDDFLTVTVDGNKNLDREALVRKKLLESFYGKSAVAAAKPDNSIDSDDADFDALDDSPRKLASRSFESVGDSTDLDSPNFDAEEHTRKHVHESSVHALLDTEEKLSLQVRTLDSTMQTLVYENYSRFIDATDAIRSIGVNVQANEKGLQRLTAGMQTIDEQSRSVEDALGDLRDQVAEKIRIKRLLTRLDALLKLPETLQEQITAGKYRTATRSYLSASSILSKHSQGFESLRTIEAECNTILTTLKKDLKTKILHWSGRLNSLGHFDDASDGNDEAADVPDPPRNMTEIFECAGTLYILLQSPTETAISEEDQVESELDADDLQSMAVSASMRLLDRLLDTHLIEVQERRFAAPRLDEGGLDMKLAGASLEPLDVPPKGSCFVPREFLDAILEAATLFGMSFRNDGNEGGGGGYLLEFVSEAFASGLTHVRSILLEESIHISSGEVVDESETEEEGQESPHEEITGALSILIQSVRELASGLALPEVGIDPEFASGLVDQATELTESMVRRRVDQKFHALRLNVVQDCLIPFATRIVEERATKSTEEEGLGLSQLVQIASMTLSDCLQLVDDTVRSVFSGGSAMGEDSSSSTDLPILKEAVDNSTRRFAFWLASSLEILAGGESSDPKDIMEVSFNADDEGARDDDVSGTEIDTNITVRDDMSDLPGQDDTKIRDLVESALQELLSGDDNEGANAVHSDFILAIVEMCRLAERSVAENLDQSIATHLGGGKKKSRSLFPSGASSPRKGSDQEDEISKRFEFASSRVLVLYATNCGSMAADILCANVDSMTSSDGPSASALGVLEIAKTVAIECAEIFGESKRAGPVQVMEEDLVSSLSSPLGRKTGLQLDVERMFKENVPIYPHPSDIMDFSRNGVLFLLFKVAFRALLEQTRMVTVTTKGYSQLQVDIEFVKHMVSHYISSEFSVNGNNACTSLSSLMGDVIATAGERCADENEDLLYESRATVRAYLDKADSAITDKYVIGKD